MTGGLTGHDVAMHWIPSAAQLIALLSLAAGLHAQAERPTLDRLRAGEAPRTLGDLQAFEAHLQSVVERVSPSVVNVGGGSGVIVADGLVLTAGHVIRRPGQKVTLVLHDGRRVEGESLGLNDNTDTGLIRITEPGDYPAVPMGKMAPLQLGTWCFELGHPGGRREAGAPLRLGRVLAGIDEGWLTTDCTMSGGDSGGPLFDLDGNVIGINSRISADLDENMHVPIRAFREEWEQLVSATHVVSERATGRRGMTLGRLGIELQDGSLVIDTVASDSAASRAGLHAGDAITTVGGEAVADAGALQREWSRALRSARGRSIEFVVRRERWLVTLRIPTGSPPARGRGR